MDRCIQSRASMVDAMSFGPGKAFLTLNPHEQALAMFPPFFRSSKLSAYPIDEGMQLIIGLFDNTGPIIPQRVKLLELFHMPQPPRLSSDEAQPMRVTGILVTIPSNTQSP